MVRFLRSSSLEYVLERPRSAIQPDFSRYSCRLVRTHDPKGSPLVLAAASDQCSLAQKITLQGVTLARRWIGVSRGPVTVELVQEHDMMATQPAAVSAPAATVASELGDIAAGWAASEANGNIAATLSEQAIDVAESPAAAADLEPESESLDLAATERTIATDYELLDDSQELPTEADEPLVDDAIPFSDELESGPPFQEEDDSFFDPEEDSSDSLLEDDLEPSESVLPSNLNERVEAYLKSHGYFG